MTPVILSALTLMLQMVGSHYKLEGPMHALQNPIAQSVLENDHLLAQSIFTLRWT